jgi:hypothetical protein
MNSETAVLSENEQRELHNLQFGVRRSIRYHNRRRRFFDGFDRLVKVLSVIGGSAAVVAVTARYPQLGMVLAGVVAVLSAISLVVAPAQAARLYGELARRFANLEYKMKCVRDPNADQLNEFEAERLLIEADEPPPMRVLDIICHNELCEAMGEDDCEFYKVGLLQSLFAQVIDLWPSRIKKRVSHRE